MWLLAWGRVDDFSFLIVQIHFVFSLLNFIMIFPSNTYWWHVMFIIIVFDWVLTSLLPFLRRISTVLSQGISHGMWLFAWEFPLFILFLHLVSAIIISNRCAAALVVINICTSMLKICATEYGFVKEIKNYHHFQHDITVKVDVLVSHKL